MLSKAILSKTKDGKWYVRLIGLYGGVFHLLDTYEGEEGKAYWLSRLNGLVNVPIEIEE